ncbi:hypothetical protein G3480_24475 [Thiorhodococcus mannitoliphagus]|uniref:Uncharacterized protein n=1 Tax=Thiorhodococcus mannitoliphagus TaxID=329406 RepID=A0A6P1E238_9GAMM|nr:hypothetical protein [Thiorhodococcus mannitoliphagus]NEX23411.1 hypothetical protein [Thiorhodococcus mannitoliphagus]
MFVHPPVGLREIACLAVEDETQLEESATGLGAVFLAVAALLYLDERGVGRGCFAAVGIRRAVTLSHLDLDDVDEAFALDGEIDLTLAGNVLGE